ncbi:serine hydrolase [Ruegeria atlantica]|uniref:6-aminohexanoate-dimer hydrolase n=1 Tax=Ruegeria atlantica TaxID=81569 RepID=A0A0P1EME8_9RHOB|nr:serine hydrolase [Ruegeria atlantica]CUH42616.1 6-aminohexanoate-dimer hydrolase [Ruegeria atlantica]
MSRLKVAPNPDLTVGPDNKQRWNQPAHRRHGFHNAHRLFRRTLMVRSRNVLMLEEAHQDLTATVPALADLLAHPAFSAFCCLREGQVIMEQAAPDFGTDRPHSIQSITKLHIHLIMGQLIGQGFVSPDAKVAQYLPDIGSGYREANVQALLDMAVSNDFAEDYDDPHADCYDEEIALGWRLPTEDQEEISLKDFASRIRGFRETEARTVAEYKSANTDVLTLIAAQVCPVPLTAQIERIADAVGYEGAFHISLSKDGFPAFSGGGCLSARDLARFGLFLARGGLDLSGNACANANFLRQSLTRSAPSLTPPKEWLRYSNHIMTDGRVVAHAGYGGQFLMVDTVTGTSCAFLSVLENDAGYDDTFMSNVAQVLRHVCCAETA